MARRHNPPPKTVSPEVTKAKEIAAKVLKLLHDEGCSRDEASLTLTAAMYNITIQLDDARKAALKAKVGQANWR